MPTCLLAREVRNPTGACAVGDSLAHQDAVKELAAQLEEQTLLARQANENSATIGQELNACCAKLAEAESNNEAEDKDNSGFGFSCEQVDETEFW